MGIVKSRLKSSKSKHASISSNQSFTSSNYDDIDRQNTWHFVISNIFEGRISAPIENELIKGDCNVLDAGCGPGAWTLDMASDYINSEFFGVDKAPVFPSDIKPRNVTFLTSDILNGLPFDNDSFLLVHASLMSGFTKIEYRKFIIELLRVLKPGGYIELVEPEVNAEDFPQSYRHFLDTLQSVYPEALFTHNGSDILIEILENTNLVQDVRKDVRYTHLGPSGGVVGTVALDLIEVFFVRVVHNICAEKMGMELNNYFAFWRKTKRDIIHEETRYRIVKILARKKF